MIKLVPLTSWFYGKDIMIDIFSTLVLVFILIYAIMFYKINKKPKYKYLITSFALLTVSFAFKILSNFIIYYHTTETRQLGFLTLTYQAIRSSNVLVFWGLFAHRIIFIIALYFLYLVYVEKQSLSAVILTFYLLVLAGYHSSYQYYVFHLTSLVLLLIITIFMFRNYFEEKHSQTFWMAVAFGAITLSQAVFILLNVNPIFYIIAEAIQLIGYSAILLTFIRVLSHGNKKKQDRHRLRHA